MTKETIKEAYGLSEYVDERIKDLEQRSERVMSDKRCCISSATQQQHVGRWIPDRCDMYICSKCNHTYTDLSGERYGMNYCPNCGAKMQEVEE